MHSPEITQTQPPGELMSQLIALHLSICRVNDANYHLAIADLSMTLGQQPAAGRMGLQTSASPLPDAT